jgi:hypothetical protein
MVTWHPLLDWQRAQSRRMETPNFFSSGGEEWSILGEVCTACLLFLTRKSLFSFLHPPFSKKATKGCHTFLHGEAILLAPSFPHSPFSENPFSDLREGVTTPNAKFLIFLLPMAAWSLLYVKGSRNTYIWPCIILTMCTSILEYSMIVDGCCFHNFVANQNLEGYRTFQWLFSFILRSQEEEWSKI